MLTNNLLLISSSYAGQGDYLEHCWEALDHFYNLGDGKHILFIPYANAYDWQAFAREYVSYFENHDIKVRSILDYDNPHTALGDKNLAGIFMAGGNTFKLLKYLHKYELVEPIRRLIGGGLPYAGTSAGSVVACPGIYTTNDMPIVEPGTFKALNLVRFQINPHFMPGALIAEHHGETREQRIQQFHTNHTLPVIGLKEHSWLEIHGNVIELCGKDPAVLFEANKEPHFISPGIITGDVSAK